MVRVVMLHLELSSPNVVKSSGKTAASQIYQMERELENQVPHVASSTTAVPTP